MNVPIKLPLVFNPRNGKGNLLSEGVKYCKLSKGALFEQSYF